MGEPCPAPLRVAMRSPLPFPCVPDRPYKILLVQVGTLSFSHPSFGVSVVFIYLFIGDFCCAPLLLLIRASLCTHPPLLRGDPPAGRWSAPEVDRTPPPVGRSLGGGRCVTTDPSLGPCPCREPPQRSLPLLLSEPNRHSAQASKSPVFAMQTSDATEGGSSQPDSHTCMWSIHAA